MLGPWTGAQCGQAPSPLATPNASLTPLHPLTCPNSPPTPIGDPQCPIMLPITLLAPEYLHSLTALQYTPDIPYTLMPL